MLLCSTLLIRFPSNRPPSSPNEVLINKSIDNRNSESYLCFLDGSLKLPDEGGIGFIIDSQGVLIRYDSAYKWRLDRHFYSEKKKKKKKV